jgi:hypothetical protein
MSKYKRELGNPTEDEIQEWANEVRYGKGNAE